MKKLKVFLLCGLMMSVISCDGKNSYEIVGCQVIRSPLAIDFFTSTHEKFIFRETPEVFLVRYPFGGEMAFRVNSYEKENSSKETLIFLMSANGSLKTRLRFKESAIGCLEPLEHWIGWSLTQQSESVKK